VHSITGNFRVDWRGAIAILAVMPAQVSDWLSLIPRAKRFEARSKRLALALLTLSATTSFLTMAKAENWPRFRGPTGEGRSAETSLPLRWSAESNVVWKTAIAGQGWSSPIVWGDQVFITSAQEGGTKCYVLCLRRQSGAILWDKEVFEQVPRRKEGKNSYATPTPATDGEQVYAVFADGSIVALTTGGSVVWTNREVQYYSRHGLGASPILHAGLLIMAFDGSNPVSAAGDYPNNTPEERLGWQIPWDKAQLVALDVKTGKRVWTGRRGLSRIAHVTPNVLTDNGTTQIISCAGDAIQGFEPKTGDRLWTIYSQGEGVTPSFATGDGLIYASSGFEKTTLRAVRTGGRGDVTQTHVAWEQKKGVPTQSSLLYVSPHLFAITDGGIATCYEGKTGEIVWQERVGGNFSASPVSADGHIYFLSEAGETTILETGPRFKITARNALNEKCQASIAVSQGHLFIRGERNLYCIGRKL
jgi:outer membrane protein assembly factor BamB